MEKEQTVLTKWNSILSPKDSKILFYNKECIIMKKVISIVLAFALMITFLPMSVFAADSGRYFKQFTGKSISLVDALKAVGVDSSFAYRSRIAAANGITSYTGSSQQNLHMLSLLKAGTLVSPEASAEPAQTTIETSSQTKPAQIASQPASTQPTESGNTISFTGNYIPR